MSGEPQSNLLLSTCLPVRIQIEDRASRQARQPTPAGEITTWWVFGDFQGSLPPSPSPPPHPPPPIAVAPADRCASSVNEFCRQAKARPEARYIDFVSDHMEKVLTSCRQIVACRFLGIPAPCAT
ncbi:hypothetical protein IF1G_01381 [Cordyceps javanica]|uniref:Uncharacterized protein n=1 Tax=Cordyceps javanica TaxID=43265 RepID=A0A545VBQ8_9HYPO|nr:hypothetical protein IF1G_01381 [Cordyceps javanica]